MNIVVCNIREAKDLLETPMISNLYILHYGFNFSIFILISSTLLTHQIKSILQILQKLLIFLIDYAII